jgi:alanine-synthesizing transaminase
MLEEAEVSLSPGVGFGPEGEGYVRMALIENKQRLQQAARQIRRTLARWRQEQVAAPRADS